MVTAVIALALLGLGFAHWALARRPSPWLGAVVPVVLVAALVVLFLQGVLDSGLDYAMAAVALVAVVRMWDEGRQARRKMAGAA